MAIKPTPNNSMFKSLIFDGVDSRDYGIYITGDAVFDSPERDVEMIEIPGRNGAYALDKGRFSNIEVSYPAGIAGDTEADFRQGISAFRNALASRKGYKRLEDEYNPDEYRMAVYKSGLEVTPTALKAGEFTITFDCQPQRFLKSGEIPRTIGGEVTNTQTESGAVVSIDSDGGDKVTSLVATIEPVQAGSGDPSPTNVRPITGWTTVNVIVSPTTTASDGTTTTTALGRTVYGGTLDVVTGVLTVTHKMVDIGTLNWRYINEYFYSTTTLEGGRVVSGGQTTAKCTAYKPYIGTMASFLSGNNLIWTGASNIAASPRAAVRDTRYTDATAFKSAVSGVNLVYELATPQTYNLTAQQVELLTGNNNVWADTGDITITWGDDPNKLVNPTLFESHPLVRVEGYGELSIGDADITVYSTELGRIDMPAKRTQQQFTYSQYVSNVYDTEVFTTDFLNNGDKFYWNGGQYYFPFSTANHEYVNSSSGGFDGLITTTGTYVEPSATSRIDATDWSTTAYYVGAKVLTPVEFTFGTAKTVTDSAVIDVTYTTDNGNTYTRTVTVAMSLTYTGLNNIGLSIRATNSADRAARYNTADHYFGTAPTFYGISTQTPGDLYIDADIGEAYFVAGDAILNANNYVYFVTDLPVLAPGENSVDYTGNITEVEITPRWWEV